MMYNTNRSSFQYLPPIHDIELLELYDLVSKKIQLYNLPVHYVGLGPYVDEASTMILYDSDWDIYPLYQGTFLENFDDRFLLDATRNQLDRIRQADIPFKTLYLAFEQHQITDEQDSKAIPIECVRSTNAGNTSCLKTSHINIDFSSRNISLQKKSHIRYWFDQSVQLKSILLMGSITPKNKRIHSRTVATWYDLIRLH